MLQTLRWLPLRAIPSIGLLLTIACCAPIRSQAAPVEKTLRFSAVQATAEQLFLKDLGQEKGDLISRSQVQELFRRLAKLGWQVPQPKELTDRVLADDQFLIKRLRTPDGIKFMRQVARLPNGYDRLDHLSQLQRGQKIVSELIRGPDGYKMLEYMTTSSGGANMGKMLSETPHGANFNGTTGKIYTLEALELELRARFDGGKQTARAKSR
jgi:hypothetical protein